MSAALDLENRLLAFRMLFDTHPAHIALLNDTGAILATNQAWVAFGLENGLGPDFVGGGANYFDVCQRAVENDDADALQVMTGLMAIVAGHRKRFVWVYPCHSPEATRWFRMWVSAADDDTAGLIVAHRYLGNQPPAVRNRSPEAVL